MSKTKIGVLISGSGTNLQALIDNTKNGYIDGEIAIVISNRKNAFGLQRAAENGIKNLFVTAKDCHDAAAYNHKILDILTTHNIELLVLAGYMKILTSNLIEKYKNRIINIHPSLIPSFCGQGYYGLKVHQAAIDYGVKVSGATVHFVDKIADNGPVILQEAVAVEDNDTAEILQQRILKTEHKLLPLAVKLFCENKLDVATHEGKRSKVRVME